jgi:PEGA domain-containing protein/uncharacterized protein DUF2845/uncharacterized protein DUF4124
VVGTEAKGRSFKWTDEGRGYEDLDITRKNYSEIYLKVERWYYDFGSHKFIQVLTFRGGILKKIETGDYGGANWDFIGSKGQETDKTEDTEESSALIYGTISVVGSPHGAKVYLNEQYAGNIPCRLEQMEPGAHNVIISSDGYKDLGKRIIVRASKTSYLNVYLEPDKSGAKEAVTDESDKADAPYVPARKVYKWIDENGHIHITDIPPPDASK